MARCYYSSLNLNDLKKLKYAIPTKDDVEFLQINEKGRKYPTLILKDKRLNNLCISLVQNKIYFENEFYKKYKIATKENFFFEEEYNIKYLGEAILKKLEAFNLPIIPLYKD